MVFDARYKPLHAWRWQRFVQQRIPLSELAHRRSDAAFPDSLCGNPETKQLFIGS